MGIFFFFGTKYTRKVFREGIRYTPYFLMPFLAFCTCIKVSKRSTRLHAKKLNFFYSLKQKGIHSALEDDDMMMILMIHVKHATWLL